MSDPADLAKGLAGLVDRAIADYNQAAALSWRSAPQAALFDSRGEALALTSVAAVSSLTAALATLRAFFGERWQPGDAAITNDADAGAANACEMTVVAPIWMRGATAPSWAVMRAFVPDLGGWELGGYSPQAMDRWAEGARIEAAKIAAAGKYRREVSDMVALNSRTPRLTLRCIYALVDAARSLGEGAKQAFEANGTADLSRQGDMLRSAENERIDLALSRLGTGPRKATATAVTPFSKVTLDPLTVSVTFKSGGIDIGLPQSPVAGLPINLGQHGAADCAIAAITSVLDLKGLRTGAIRDRVRLDIPAPGLFSAPLPASVCLGRATVGKAIFLAVADALSGAGATFGGEELWQTYQASHYDEGVDPKTGKISLERAAAIRCRETEETSA
jgi:N-methylhydantoinase B/oxoprolinase/acetone carboxylase alpha subunit